MFSKKIRFLNMIKKQPNLTEDAKMYIAKYKIIYKTVIREARRRDNDKYTGCFTTLGHNCRK